jgi:hypothetical protein
MGKIISHKHSFSTYLGLFTLLLAVATSGCKSAKLLGEKEPTRCKTHGTVRDYTNVEDCGYIIETEAGLFLFPQHLASEDKDFFLEPGLNIRFDYTILPNAMSLCPAKGKTAEITCITKLPNRDVDCVDCDSPSSDWMLQLIDILKPITIHKYLTDKEILYLFDCPAEKVLYDCKGNCICQEYKKDNNKCQNFPNRTGKIIYQIEQNQH